MSERRDRRPLALLAFALLFCGAMLLVYLAAMGGPDLPVAPAPAPVVVATPPPAAPKVLPSRPAPRRAPARTPAPYVEPDEEAEPPQDPLMPVELAVQVVDDRGDPLYRTLVRVQSSRGGPPRRLLTDQDGKATGRFRAAQFVVTAIRADGMLSSTSDPVTVDATEGGTWNLELVIASEPKAGLGVGIKPHPEGVEVLTVHGGTPAADAGLAKGDVIVAVEGEETAGMPLPDFIAKMTGPVGTKVLFDVVHEDGSEERLQVERALIDNQRRPDDG
ncbi:MAG: PDZ domain-containing protein [Deltaproteobacteria bacterium]|nr:PDZ domain-containing protein [Deltaproteobacteria bacterium]